jgi:type IV pilus assembly protein PilF
MIARATLVVAIAALSGCAGREARPEPHVTVASAGGDRIGPAVEADQLVAARPEEPARAVAPAPEAARRTSRADEPEAAEVLDARALAHLAAGQHALAEDAANRALAADSRFAPAHNTLGHVHLRRGELDLARAGFARAREIDPTLFVAFMNEGSLALDARLYPEALGLFTRAVEIRPADYDAWISVGVARRGMGDTAGARAAYEHAQSVDPTRPEAYFDLAVLLEHFSDGTETTDRSAGAMYEQFLQRAAARHEYAAAVARLDERCRAGRRRRWHREGPCPSTRPPRLESIDLMREAAQMQAEMERIQVQAAAEQARMRLRAAARSAARAALGDSDDS